MKFKKDDKVLMEGNPFYGTIVDLLPGGGWLSSGPVKKHEYQRWVSTPMYRVVLKKQKYPKKMWIPEDELTLDISYYRNKQIENLFKWTMIIGNKH